MGAVLAGGGDGGVRWWCRLWLWYLRLARRFEHLGLLVGVGRVGVVESRGVAGEHLDKRFGRHLLARVIDLAALVNVHAGHTLGGGLVEELAGEGVHVWQHALVQRLEASHSAEGRSASPCASTED